MDLIIKLNSNKYNEIIICLIVKKKCQKTKSLNMIQVSGKTHYWKLAYKKMMPNSLYT